jgi:hypothetical protein
MERAESLLSFGSDFSMPSLSQHNDEVEGITSAWFADYHFSYDPFLTTLASTVYPDFDIDLLCLANKVHIFLWIVDDNFVDTDKVPLNTKLRVLRDCIEVSSHLVRRDNRKDELYFTVSELGKCLSDLMNDGGWDSRLRNHVCNKMIDYFLGCIQHIGIGCSQLTVDVYDRVRLSDAGCRVTFCLSLLGRPKELIDSALNFLESNEGEKFSDMANRNVTYVNDILSIKKDKKSNEFNFNVIKCWMEQHAVSESEAVSKVAQICNQMYHYIDSESKSASTTGKLYVLSSLKLWCVGSKVWHYQASRYKALSPRGNQS